jgi:hypothetical protein
MPSFPDPPSGESNAEKTLRRLDRLVGPDHARFVLVRTRNHEASTALISELLDRRAGIARVVLYPSGRTPTFYRSTIGSARPWTIVYAADVPGSIDLTARSMSAAHTVVTFGTDDMVVRALWLPPSVLEGYAGLPATPDAVLVVDDWYALVTDYLGESSAGSGRTPSSDELDRLLCDAFLALSEAHLIVVTSGPTSILERAADAVVDVRRADGDANAVEVRFVRDPFESVPGEVYVLRRRGGGGWE